MTGTRGVLGGALLPLLADRAIVAIDRADGFPIADGSELRAALEGCDAIVHLAALHPLVAGPGADYTAANVAPFRDLLTVAAAAGMRRVVLASSTSVWRDAPMGAPARFIDEDSPADAADDPYAASKLACEALLRTSGLEGVTLRLARFAAGDSPEERVRRLYRAVRPADAARAVISALDRAVSGSAYAIASRTPFRIEDAELLDRDPAEAVRLRAGFEPEWIPGRIGSVVLTDRAALDLGWSASP